MDAVFDMCYLSGADGNNVEPNDIPKTKESIWVLGKKYSAIQDLDRIRRDITSIIWCTYRKGFVPIGDEGLTSDKGWGCMLRCGQMVLGVALVRVHLSVDWVWSPETRDPTYLKIIQRFEERKQAPYSIHQVALMGASEGKEVGQWFGPNTIAQVLKKLTVYDKWSSLAIHVALDNTVVKEDILQQCLVNNDRGDTSSAPDGVVSDWMPLLLIVPLRLGLSEINPVYVNGLKMCFQCPQSIGVIGGKPNQALYLIGCVEDEVIYLDPHTTQRSGLVESKITDDQKEMDCTYHCKYASRIPILSMDPSVAVCFLCRTRGDFYELCETIEQEFMKESQPLFEICEKRPSHWGPNTTDIDFQSTSLFTEFEDVDRQFDDSDEEFEIL
ncbi:cysteine protease ATG4B [Bombyx mandarina]|uniref:Cysteine protease n=2 Tax=Bombyx TaxID=7090 RepID=A0A8R2LTI3_BOMMO|nr:cysteine protease ATG4B [Bombyx mandarina]XP_037866680.1 cysteine protease ATG4B [Bombyx mori]